jgi:hypothetical protein
VEDEAANALQSMFACASMDVWSYGMCVMLLAIKGGDKNYWDRPGLGADPGP